MDEAQKKAQTTYNLAADNFDEDANAYWDIYGRKTIEKLKLTAGSSVLDVACGTGASAIPAAQAVGSEGKVLGLDLADNMLALARKKAKAKGLSHLEFKNGDMTDLSFNEEFDAVVCVFGIFFVPDMESLIKRLWRTLKPGGKLIITSWGPNLFEPMYKVFDAAVKPINPNLVSAFRPWDRLIETAQLEKLLSVTGSKKIEVVAETGEQVIGDGEAWWKIVLGSGLRAVPEALGGDHLKVKDACSQYISKNSISSIQTNVNYGIAIK